jgi:Flp pilus assembly protein TadG
VRPGFRARLDIVVREEDRASAIIEFIFVAVVVLIPLVYLVVAVAVVQRSQLAVTNAARDVGRSIAIARTPDGAENNAEVALRIALSRQGISPQDVELKYVTSADDCDSPSVTPNLAPGLEFAVCVTTHRQLPTVPSILSGRGVTIIGRFVVHVDDYQLKASR